MLGVAKGRLPKQALTALPSLRSPPCASQLNQADGGNEVFRAREAKGLYSICLQLPCLCDCWPSAVPTAPRAERAIRGCAWL